MRRILVMLLIVLVFLSGFIAHAAFTTQISTAAPSSAYVWVPVHVAPENEVWTAGMPSWSVEYDKQYWQTAFQVCGLFNGAGFVTLTYGDDGDPYYVNYQQPTPLCITVQIAWGGGTMAHQLAVYLDPHVTITNPNVFVGQSIITARSEMPPPVPAGSGSK